MSYWTLYLQNLLKGEEGQDLIEYALIIVVIVLVAAAGLTGIGDEIATIFEDILAELQGTTP